jgi:hypothetical protein
MDDYGIGGAYCDKCEIDFFQLIDLLIKDIQHLESKVVYLRYFLSGFLPEHDGEMLMVEIFSNLSGLGYGQPVYRRYVSKYCDGNDPMEDADFIEHMMKLSLGKESVDL